MICACGSLRVGIIAFAMRSIILVHVHCKHGVLDVSDWAIGLYATPLLQRAPRLIHRGCARRVPAGRKRRIGESGTLPRAQHGVLTR